MKFRIQRYDPEKDAKPHFQDYDVEMGPADRMLLDAKTEKRERLPGGFQLLAECGHEALHHGIGALVKPVAAQGGRERAEDLLDGGRIRLLG